MDNPADYQPLLELSLRILGVLGVTSLLGFLSLYAAWLKFPPELVIEAVLDKSKQFHSESRIKVKNIGVLPALQVVADAENICAKIGGITMRDCGSFNGPSAFPRLSGGETGELSVTPGVGFGSAARIAEFSYRLTLKYQARLFFFRRNLRKSWKVELRMFSDGFSWNISLAA